MQPNTSLAADYPRFPWAAFHSCLYTAYYTISGMSAAFSSHPCRTNPPPAAILSRSSQPPIFFPFTIKTFYRSNFLFTIIPQPMSSPHFSHLAAPALLQLSPSPGLILSFTSAIQSSLSLLPSLPASPPSDDSAPSSSASSSSMLGRSLLSSFGNAWLNS